MRSQGTLKTWRKWKDEIKPQCEYAVDDVTLCNARVCPCKRMRMGRWFDEHMQPWLKAGVGHIGGLVKFLRLVERHDAD
jgi:hypothetical protein